MHVCINNEKYVYFRFAYAMQVNIHTFQGDKHTITIACAFFKGMNAFSLYSTLLPNKNITFLQIGKNLSKDHMLNNKVVYILGQETLLKVYTCSFYTRFTTVDIIMYD